VYLEVPYSSASTHATNTKKTGPALQVEMGRVYIPLKMGLGVSTTRPLDLEQFVKIKQKSRPIWELPFHTPTP